MHASNRGVFTHVTQYLLDLLCLVAAFAISDLIAVHAWHPVNTTRFFWVLIAYPVVFYMAMQGHRMYVRTTFLYWDRIVRNILSSALLGGLFCIAIIPFISENLNQSRFLGVFLLISTKLVILQRILTLLFIHRKEDRNDLRCLAIGDPDIISQYRYYMGKTSVRTSFVGYIPVVTATENGGQTPITSGSLALSAEQEPIDHVVRARHLHELSLPCLGMLEDLERVLGQHVVDEVLFALPKDYEGGVEKYVLMCEERGLTVKLALNLFDLRVAKTHVHAMGTIPVLTYHTVSLNDYQLFLKRCMDIAGALVGLLIMGMLSILVVPAIKLDSKGPVFFKQDRVGQNGRIFKLYKFRSMCADAEAKKKELQAKNRVKDGMMFKLDHDPRITKVGAFLRKSSIDELPQFINVLRGDMSLVGTRPPTLDEVEKYCNLHHRRISIRPGITGNWQVSGRSDIRDFDEVCRLDTSYIDNWTVWADIRIILKTVAVIFQKRGAL